MLLSLVICTRNRAEALGNTLASLSRLPLPDGADLEILVVDNGSTDSTRTVVESHAEKNSKISYILESIPGKSTALNTGLARSRGEILLLTDDDVIPNSDWLSEITRPLLSRKYHVLTGKVTIAPHLLRPWMEKIHRAWLASTEYIDPDAPATAVGANMAFRREVLDQVPHFDVELGPGRLGLWEDTLFAMQTVKAGYRLGMVQRASMVHHFEPSRLTRASFLARARAEARSSAYVARHWAHDIRKDRIKLLAKMYIHLMAKRVTRWSSWRQSEGMPEWEINLLTGIENAHHFAREMRRAPLYSQYGMNRGVVSPTPP